MPNFSLVFMTIFNMIQFKMADVYGVPKGRPRYFSLTPLIVLQKTYCRR